LSGVLSSSDPNRAGQCCEQAIAIHRQLADSHPDDLDYSRDLALGYSQLGALQRGQRRLDAAEQSYRRAVQIGQRLALRAPANTDFRCELAGSRSNLGQALLDLDRPQEALVEFEVARELIEQLRVIDSRDVRYVSGWGGVLNNLGTALLTLRTKEAVAPQKQAVDMQRAAVHGTACRPLRFLDNHLANLAERSGKPVVRQRPQRTRRHQPQVMGRITMSRLPKRAIGPAGFIGFVWLATEETILSQRAPMAGRRTSRNQKPAVCNISLPVDAFLNSGLTPALNRRQSNSGPSSDLTGKWIAAKPWGDFSPAVRETVFPRSGTTNRPWLRGQRAVGPVRSRVVRGKRLVPEHRHGGGRFGRSTG
jgi:hypothetical protein